MPKRFELYHPLIEEPTTPATEYLPWVLLSIWLGAFLFSAYSGGA